MMCAEYHSKWPGLRITLPVRPFLASVGLLGVVWFEPTQLLALNADNPYNPIVLRNAFALKDPPPVIQTVLQPPKPPTNVELRGITTLLGRPQVLLNFKVPGTPPEPPKDRSMVMDVGQREGDVEVLEINPVAGTIRIRNQGTELAMNLRDNAAKPQSAPSVALPIPSLPPGAAPQLPVPAPAANPAPALLGTPTAPVLPTRNLRSAANNAAAKPLTALEQSAIMEIERERTKVLVQQGKMPPLPPMPFSHREGSGSASP